MGRLRTLFSTALFLATTLVSAGAQALPTATNGSIDLRGTDLNQPVELSGEWDYYWRNLSLSPQEEPSSVTVPAGWSASGVPRRGFGTYALTIRHDMSGGDLALRFLHVNGPFAVFVDGRLIGGVGRVGRSRRDYGPDRGVVVIPIRDPEPEFRLQVQVSSFEHRYGGLVSTVYLGTETAILRFHQRSLNRQTFLLGIIMAIGLYHLGLFLNRPKDRSPLYFALFCLFYLGWQFITGENYGTVLLPNLPWRAALRIEYICFQWSAGFFFIFVHELFRQDYSTRVLRIYQIGAGFFSAWTLFAPALWVSLSLIPFQVFFLLAVIYALAVLLLAAIRRRRGARLLLIGLAVAFLTAVNDILYFDHILKTGQIMGYGIAAFLLFQAFFLSRRFAQSFEQVEILSMDLERANQALRESQKRIEAQHAEMVRLAHQDHLTGLPNRMVLFDTITREISRARRNSTLVAVMMLDLDEFKDVNDSMGHQAGDALLQKVSRRLARIVRRHDQVFRLGGDEFTIVILDTQIREQINAVAEKILRAFSQPFEILDREMLIRASMGISVFPDDGVDVHTLIKNADTAMYRIKKARKGRFVFFDTTMGRESQDRISLSGKLPRALAQKQFKLHYQLQVDEKIGSVQGVEALVRWNDPEEGLVSPGRFIPVAEQTGFVVELGEWILEEACRQARVWQETGFPSFSVSVNISALQFATDGFVRDIASLIRSIGIRPETLVLELTERIIMRDEEQVISKLHELKELGIQISIDDFGTGYSSLNYLRRFPLDHLKIDQSFVRNMFANDYDSEIARTIIDLAHVLDLDVVAEGVETEEQRRFLLRNNCHLMQGYYFGRPVSGLELKDSLDRYRSRSRTPRAN